MTELQFQDALKDAVIRYAKRVYYLKGNWCHMTVAAMVVGGDKSNKEDHEFELELMIDKEGIIKYTDKGAKLW